MKIYKTILASTFILSLTFLAACGASDDKKGSDPKANSTSSSKATPTPKNNDKTPPNDSKDKTSPNDSKPTEKPTKKPTTPAENKKAMKKITALSNKIGEEKINKLGLLIDAYITEHPDREADIFSPELGQLFESSSSYEKIKPKVNHFFNKNKELKAAFKKSGVSIDDFGHLLFLITKASESSVAPPATSK